MEKEHAYLGHFRGCMKDGHNTNPWPKDDTKLSDVVNATRTERKEEQYEKRTPSVGVRG